MVCLGLNKVSHTKASDKQLPLARSQPSVYSCPSGTYTGSRCLLQRVLYKTATTPLMKINLKLQDKQNANTQVRKKEGNDWGRGGPDRPSQDQ